MMSVNDTPAGASTTTAFDGLLLITYLSISLCEIRLIYYCAKNPDSMNIPKKCKSNIGIGAMFDKKSDRLSKTDRSDADWERK